MGAFQCLSLAVCFSQGVANEAVTVAHKCGNFMLLGR